MRGSIRKRSEDSWTLIFDAGRDPATGKRRQQWVSFKGTKKAAGEELTRLLREIDTGGFVKPTKLTVAEFLRQWLRDYASTNVRATTYQSYVFISERHLIPALGSVALTDLRPAHLQAFYAKALTQGRLDGAGGLSAKSVSYFHKILSEALSHAVKWGMVARNVAQAVDPPQPMKAEMRVLDGEGIGTVLEKVKGTRWYPLFHLAAYTGMRRSELLGLRWKDVDLDMATLSVVQVLHQLHDRRIVFQEPKTAKGSRTIALSPSAVLGLREYRDHQTGDALLMGQPLTPETLVFSNPDGTPFLPDSVSQAFRIIAHRLGQDGVNFHSLRHSHASLMLKQGVHPKIVQERLGHSSIAITLDTYSHVAPGLQAAAAQRFDEALATPRLVEARSPSK